MCRSKGTTIISVMLMIAIILSSINISCIRVVKYSGKSAEKPLSYLYPTSEMEFVQAILFQGAIADAALRFIDASMSTDELMKDDQNLGSQQWLDLAEQTQTKWEESEAATARLQEIANILPDYELPAVAQGGMPSLSFANTVFAEEGEEQYKWYLSKETAEEKGKRLAEEWREAQHKQGKLVDADLELLSIYDKAPPGDRVLKVAMLLDTSMQEAQQYLAMLRDLQTGQEYDAAKAAEVQAKYLTYTASAAATAWFIYGLGFLAASTAVGTTANVLAATVTGGKLIIDWSDTAVTFAVTKDETVAYIAKLKDDLYVKAATTLVSIRNIVNAVNNFRDIYNAARKLTGDDKPISWEAIKSAWKNIPEKERDRILRQSVNGFKGMIDIDKKLKDYLDKNPEVKSIELNPLMGRVLVAGDRTNKLISHSDRSDVIKATGDFIKVIYNPPPTLHAELGSKQLKQGEHTSLTITITPPQSTEIMVDGRMLPGGTGNDGVLITDYQALPVKSGGANRVVVRAPELGLEASNTYTSIVSQLRVTAINKSVAQGGVVKLKIEIDPPLTTMITISELNDRYFTDSKGLLEIDYPVDQQVSPGAHRIYVRAVEFGLDASTTVTVTQLSMTISPLARDGEAGKTYEFQAKATNPPASAYYNWFVNDNLVNGHAWNNFITFPNPGIYHISVKLVLAGKVLAEGGPSQAIINPGLPGPIAKGKVFIGSVPAGADIYIGGRKQPYQTPHDFDFEAGKYTVALKKAGYKDYSATAEVAAGRITELWAKLEAVNQPTPKPSPTPKPTPPPTPAPTPMPTPSLEGTYSGSWEESGYKISVRIIIQKDTFSFVLIDGTRGSFQGSGKRDQKTGYIEGKATGGCTVGRFSFPECSVGFAGYFNGSRLDFNGRVYGGGDTHGISGTLKKE